MPHPFPHQYNTSLEWTADATAKLVAAPRPTILGGPPPEFDGPDHVWSPEHLLLNAVNLCLMTTFIAIGRKNHVEVLKYSSEAKAALDKTKDGIQFTSIHLSVDLKVPGGQKEQAEKTLLLAKKHCLISNALKTEVTISFEIAEA